VCKVFLYIVDLNMCLFCTVTETFSVEYWRDLEIWVRGVSRSLKMVKFENFGRVSFPIHIP